MAMLDLQGMEFGEDGEAHHSSTSKSCGVSTLSLLLC
jgi:hypothetical protein